MKIKKILFGIMMVAALLILARPTISNAATYSGAWLPNDSDIFVIELTLTAGTDSFYMYDWDNSAIYTDFEVSGTVVPIPGAVWLLGSGLIGLVALRRKSS